jgi:hypothetical protein
MGRLLYKEARIKRNKQNEYYQKIQLFQETSKNYDELFDHVEMMRDKMRKLSIIKS